MGEKLSRREVDRAADSGRLHSSKKVAYLATTAAGKCNSTAITATVFRN